MDEKFYIGIFSDLHPDHAMALIERGINDRQAEARGYYTTTEKQHLESLGFNRSQAATAASHRPVLVIPLHGPNGEVENYQIRPNRPRVIERNGKQRVFKYELPGNTTVCIVCPPTERQGESLKASNVPLFITESTLKADAGLSIGLLTIGILGVDGWRAKNIYDGVTTHPAWEEINLKRDVYFAHDSDSLENKRVRRAIKRHRGAIPEARTKYQAQEAERKIRDQIFEGKYSKAQSRKTLKEFVEEVYLPWAKVNKRSWRSDYSRLKPILAHFGKKRLSDISPFQIERYKIERLKMPIVRGENGEKTRPRSRASINREVRLLSRIFTLAIANCEASTNPVSQVKLFKGENRRTRYLLPEEEERLMAQLTGQRAHIRLIVVVALHTGMRMGEIVKLKREDIDFHRGESRVTRTKTDEDRFVPMNDTLYRELMSHCSNLKTDYVFANPETGKARGQVKRSFVTACRLAEIEDFRFHDLRHTAATRMGEAGIDPFTIAAILGHKSIAMTASYTHATQRAKRLAVAALEEAIEKQGHNVGHKQQQRPLLTAAK